MTTPITEAAAGTDTNLQQQQQLPPQVSSTMSDNNYAQLNRALEDLVKFISLPPSKDSLFKLAGNMITAKIQNIASTSASSTASIHLQHYKNDTTPAAASSSLSELDLNQHLMIAYLRAAAHHLHVIAVDSQQFPLTTNNTYHINFDMDIDSSIRTILPVRFFLICEPCCRSRLKLFIFYFALHFHTDNL